MLVISRKPGESLVISDQIKVTVLNCSGDKITIGIEAPKEIKIVRQELLETIEANRASAERIGSGDYNQIAMMLKNKNSAEID